MPKVPVEERKILVIHTGGIGDLIMATPALKSIRHIFPKATIHFLGNPKSVEAIQNLRNIDEIITLDTGEIKKSFFGRIIELFRSIGFLRNQRYSILFVLQPQLSFGAAIRMGLFTLSLGIPERLGRNTDGRGFFLTKKVNETSSCNKHEVERMLDIAKLLGEIPRDFNLQIPIPQCNRGIISDFFNHNNVSCSDFVIVLAPGFGKPTRAWYPERWAQLGDRLVSKYSGKIILIGGLKEVNLANQISNIMKERPIIIVGKTNISQTAALLERCHLVITNDSGPMHIAAAVGVNIVALFGPGDYNRIRPYGDTDKFIIVKKKVDCAPCYKVQCKDHRCMRDISVDDVFEAVDRICSKNFIQQGYRN